MEACRKEILRKTTVVSQTPHTLISVHLQTYLQDKICIPRNTLTETATTGECYVRSGKHFLSEDAKP